MSTKTNSKRTGVMVYFTPLELRRIKAAAKRAGHVSSSGTVKISPFVKGVAVVASKKKR